jgi:hypothetical protein
MAVSSAEMTAKKPARRRGASPSPAGGPRQGSIKDAGVTPVVSDVVFFGFFCGLLALVLMGVGNPAPGAPVRKFARSMMPAATPTLHYFDARGRAEAIRLAFIDNNFDFVEHSFTKKQWGQHTPDGLKANMTQAGMLAFGQVPMLEIDGVTLTQSHTILRFVARREGWYDWYSNIEQGAIDMAADGTEDVRKQVRTRAVVGQYSTATQAPL